MRCPEVQKFTHAYLDGEFDAGDREQFERHVMDCAGCQRLVAFEQSFKATLKARLRRPPPPPDLRERIRQALDRADAAGEGPVPRPWRRAALLLPMAAAAAALLILLSTFVTSRASSPILEEAIRAHEKNLPVEVKATEDMRRFFANRVPVPVKPPALAAEDAALLGARFGHLRGRDAAQLSYRVGTSPMTVYIFDPTGLPHEFGRRRVVRDREMFVGGARGYNVVFYQDRGVGYAFASDLDEDELLRIVSTSFAR